MYFKKVKLIIHDCLPILMLLYIMLYVMLAYLMLFAALSNAVCFYNVFVFLLLTFVNAFCFMLCLGLLTQFVYFKYDFSSCAVLLICSFCYVHTILYMKGLCTLWRNST